ncbi:MAG: hypothetical protein VX385_04955, partial [Acidobacteriota bacterium]|nr:hypothetical protein [Acidobacteriota bacterium]
QSAELDDENDSELSTPPKQWRKYAIFSPSDFPTLNPEPNITTKQRSPSALDADPRESRLQ